MLTQHNAMPQSIQIIKTLLWATPLAILISSIANLGLYAAAGSIASEVTAWSGAGEIQIISATFVYLTFGAITFVGVAQFSKNPARVYVRVATIGLLLSLFLPITAGLGYGDPSTATPTMATVITLCLMHVLTFILSVPLFLRVTRD